jgi:hypothetical protein
MVQTPQHETATPVLLTPLGSTTQQGSRPHDDSRCIEPFFKIHALRLTLFRVLLETPYSGVPFRHCRPRLGMTRSSEVATFADYVATLPL